MKRTRIRPWWAIIGLVLAGSLQAQMPLFRNAFTTNVPGAWVRGDIVYGERLQVINPNTGPTGLFFFVGTNAYGIGTPWMMVTNGLVGIGGYPNSSYALDVTGSSRASLLVSVGDIYAGANSSYLWNVVRSPSIGRVVGGVTINPTVGVTNILAVRNTNGVDVLVVNSNGFTGIVTNTPTVALEVHGTVRSTNFQLIIPQWDDVRIPVGTLSSPSSAPGRKIFIGNLTTYAFDDAADEQLDFELQIPHGIATNNAYGIHLHLHYTGTNAPTGTSNIVWGIEFAWSNPALGIFPSVTQTNYSTNGLTATRQHMLAEFPVITGMKESAVLIGRLFRDANNGADEYVGDALAISFDAHYPRLQMGSHGEYGDF
jgi:hypothetical protein